MAPLGFFCHGQLTYQECYTDLEPDVCVGLPASSLATSVRDGPLIAQPPPIPFARSFAVILPELREGAYQLRVGELDPVDVYCTGRGVVLGPAVCEINACGLSTPNFVTTTAAPATSGQFCYHTCYSL